MKLVILFEDTVHPHRAGDDTIPPSSETGSAKAPAGSREQGGEHHGDGRGGGAGGDREGGGGGGGLGTDLPLQPSSVADEGGGGGGKEKVEGVQGIFPQILFHLSFLPPSTPSHPFKNHLFLLHPLPLPGIDPEVERGQPADDGEGVELPQPAGGCSEERRQLLLLPGDRGHHQERQSYFRGGHQERQQFYYNCERGEQPCV